MLPRFLANEEVFHADAGYDPCYHAACLQTSCQGTNTGTGTKKALIGAHAGASAACCGSSSGALTAVSLDHCLHALKLRLKGTLSIGFNPVRPSCFHVLETVHGLRQGRSVTHESQVRIGRDSRKEKEKRLKPLVATVHTSKIVQLDSRTHNLESKVLGLLKVVSRQHGPQLLVKPLAHPALQSAVGRLCTSSGRSCENLFHHRR